MLVPSNILLSWVSLLRIRILSNMISNNFTFPKILRLLLGFVLKKMGWREFPGGPVVKTPRFHCGEHGFDPWSGN